CARGRTYGNYFDYW
nr:immunoglobulin heavy chain junction region [Mus musculus]MBK4186197.1 immunoglobulin heavy chain junction region [Mus musculus]MBK4186198.1 immunoglobulin heavy chain junction region [Mus musculus]MBK4186199.1 immunoglobulin heavy chain junction region [Mus musculus]MBK4186200.1 immunoglobulin heavy chain junction region [Mus musculus]